MSKPQLPWVSDRAGYGPSYPLGRMMASHLQTAHALFGAVMATPRWRRACAGRGGDGLRHDRVFGPGLSARRQGRVGFWGHAAMLPYASMYTLDIERVSGSTHTMKGRARGRRDVRAVRS